jgi:hypothetical protein
MAMMAETGRISMREPETRPMASPMSLALPRKLIWVWE